MLLQDQQGSSPCDTVHRAGVVTSVVFRPVQTFSAAAEAVGEDLGSPAPSLGLEEEKEQLQNGP